MAVGWWKSGEYGLELLLDKCLDATAQLRLQIWNLIQKIRNLSAATRELCAFEAQQLLLSAQILNDGLESWVYLCLKTLGMEPIIRPILTQLRMLHPSMEFHQPTRPSGPPLCEIDTEAPA